MCYLCYLYYIQIHMNIYIYIYIYIYILSKLDVTVVWCKHFVSV